MSLQPRFIPDRPKYKGDKVFRIDELIQSVIAHGDSDECLLWEASGGRYGQVTLNGKIMRVSRVSYTLFKGDIPPGLFVCHKCDRPRCFSPDHLFLGTARDNIVDAINKGRVVPAYCLRPPRGEAGAHSKLSEEEEVHEIRRRYANGESKASLSRAYGISFNAASAVVRRLTWKHI